MLRPSLLACILFAIPAGAADWTVTDLGRLYKDHHCMKASERTFRNLMGEARIEYLYASDWVTYADGINGRHDALITCTFGDNRGTRATLVIHSDARGMDLLMLQRRILALFERNAHQITRAWKDSYN